MDEMLGERWRDGMEEEKEKEGEEEAAGRGEKSRDKGERRWRKAVEEERRGEREDRGRKMKVQSVQVVNSYYEL